MFDVQFCRDQFAPLSRDLVYLENAGGSYVPETVVNCMSQFMRETQTQPCWEFDASVEADTRINRGTQAMADFLNASVDEIVVGPSTTLNVYVLCAALSAGWSAGDEVIVTGQDHEANSGAWRRLADTGIVVREWPIDPVTGELSLADLGNLLNVKTRLVCCPHVSNIVGSVNDVTSITSMAHAAGAMTCIDGVAAVAHLVPDVKSIGCDFYLFSTYKLYGPHQAILYARREHIEACANQNHFFHAQSIPGKLNPGGTNYESAASLEGIGQYFDMVHGRHFEAVPDFRTRVLQVFDLFRDQEAALMAPLAEYLGSRDDIRIIGNALPDPTHRAPTFSFAVVNRSSEGLARELGNKGFAVGFGNFYAWRCVETLGFEAEDGVLRVSMTHYNTVDEINRFVTTFDQLL